MKICIFGAASAKIDREYIERCEALGEQLAKRGHALVFGAGATGMMGAAARGFKRGGGEIYGVIPEFFRDEKVEEIYGGCTKLIFTRDMSERKRTMEDLADAFIITPGGVGTFEEFFEVLTLKQLGRHKKAMVVYNIAGYYDDLESFLKQAAERKFISFDCEALYSCLDKESDVIDYLDEYVPDSGPWHKYKIS